MGSPGAALLLLLPLLFYPGCTEDVKVVNALLGNTVQLNLNYSGTATGYTWTKEIHRVAEWDDPLNVTYYDTLKGRCELNISTGVLTIRNLQEADSARYKGEALVNSLYILSNFHLRVFPNLTNPTVTCGVKGENYTIHCDHQSNPENYSWRSQGQLVAETDTNYWFSNSGKTLTLKNANAPFQSLECVVQNPASEKSAPVPPDCFKDLRNKKENTHEHHGLIAVIVCILAALVGFLCWKYGICLPQWLSQRGIDAQDSPEQQTLMAGIPQDQTHPVEEEGDKKRKGPVFSVPQDQTRPVEEEGDKKRKGPVFTTVTGLDQQQSSVVEDMSQGMPDGDPKRETREDHDESGNHRPSSQHLPISDDERDDKSDTQV